MAVNSVPRSGFQAKRGKAENDKVGFRADCCAELWSATEVEPTSQSATEVEPTSQSATEVEPAREQCEHCDRVINSNLSKAENSTELVRVMSKQRKVCEAKMPKSGRNHRTVI